MTNGDERAALPSAARAPSAARRSRLLPYGRVIAAGLLLLIVFAGIHAAGPAIGSAGPLRQHAVALGAGLEIALACLLGGLAIRARRSPDAGRLATTLRSHVRRATGIIMVAVVVVEVVNLAGHGRYERLLAPKRGKGPVRRAPSLNGTKPPARGHAFDLRYLLYALIALLILAAIVACAIFISRVKVRDAGGYAGEPAEDETEELRQAVESGRRALRALDDARKSIIACYVAMEGSLARAGTARTVTETPDELLGRAAASGLIRGHAAARLTALFYEARFSSHDLPEAARNDARQALDQISAELRAPESSMTVTAPAGREDP